LDFSGSSHDDLGGGSLRNMLASLSSLLSGRVYGSNDIFMDKDAASLFGRLLASNE